MNKNSRLLNFLCLRLTQPVRNSKRGGGNPPRYVPKKYASYTDQQLTPENEEFVRNMMLEKETELYQSVVSPLKEAPCPRGVWTPESKRTGLICKKIGMMPQWDNKGERMLCTLLEILDNHVISYQDPETWYRNSIIGRRKVYNSKGAFGKLTVGAIAADPQLYTAAYRGVFEKAGVMPKKKLASFMITENAKIEPGTRLTAAHFRVGQFVDVTGRSIDWGFQGVMHRWGFKGQMYLRGQATKTHRRPGAIGTSGDSMVKLGKHLPGHMGWEWRTSVGLPILRIDLNQQVVIVKGAVPGDMNEILQIKDSFVEGKKVENPPFPTYYDDEDSEPLPSAQFVESIHRMAEPTIMFPEGDGDYESEIAKQLARAKVKKQAKAKRK